MLWSIFLNGETITIEVSKAKKEDLDEILKLQYLAYQSEAKLLDNFSIQPLTESLEELDKEYEKGTVYKAIDQNGRIIGSVRGYIQGKTLYIGKLIVHPSWYNKVIAKSYANLIKIYI